jgi:hypothetical protein
MMKIEEYRYLQSFIKNSVGMYTKVAAVCLLMGGGLFYYGHYSFDLLPMLATLGVGWAGGSIDAAKEISRALAKLSEIDERQ